MKRAFFFVTIKNEFVGDAPGGDENAVNTPEKRRWAGCEIVRLETVDSTNRYARMLAAQGAPHGTLVLARQQTAGRGRRGRNWISPAGEGIFMSLIVRPGTAVESAGGLSLQAALAAARAIARTGGIDARIKWPNDIVCGGRKVCGMLLEMDTDGQGLQDVVIGVGINVHQTEFPEEIMHTASSLDLLSGRRTDSEALTEAFLEEFEAAYALARSDHEAFMRAYCGLSATLGQRVQVIAAGETYTGTAENVTDSGTLLVRREDGVLREVLAADVSVRGLMGYA